MKKVLSLAVVAVFLSTTAYAQIGESKSKKIETTYTTTTTTRIVSDNSNYNRIFGGYAQAKFSTEGFGESLHGFNAGWLGGFNVIPAKKLPLYLEVGAALNAGFGKVLTDADKLLSIELPINITYRYNIPNTKIRLSPYFGFHFKMNVLARGKEEVLTYDADSWDDIYDPWDEYDSWESPWYVPETKEESFSYFDEVDGAKRFQFGMQLGVNFDFNHFYVGVGWNKDFLPCMKGIIDGEALKVSTSGARVNIGFTF